jgi:cyclopentanol dehydrogenase
MHRVKGKVILVTGAAAGMGRSHAELLASEGARVVLADLDLNGVMEAARVIEAHGGAALALKLDVSREADWSAALTATRERFGTLHGLINNAGVIDYKSLTDTSLEDWNRVFSINVAGCFLGCQMGAQAMRGSSGAIVNVSSALGLVAVAGAASYVASKGAVTMLTKAAAAELAPVGIRVNSVHPGLVDTPMIARFRADPAAIDALLGPTLIRRMATPLEVSKAVLFLVSDEASYMTGTALTVDGGYTAV